MIKCSYKVEHGKRKNNMPRISQRAMKKNKLNKKIKWR